MHCLSNKAVWEQNFSVAEEMNAVKTFPFQLGTSTGVSEMSLLKAVRSFSKAAALNWLNCKLLNL